MNVEDDKGDKLQKSDEAQQKKDSASNGHEEQQGAASKGGKDEQETASNGQEEQDRPAEDSGGKKGCDFSKLPAWLRLRQWSHEGQADEATRQQLARELFADHGSERGPRKGVEPHILTEQDEGEIVDAEEQFMWDSELQPEERECIEAAAKLNISELPEERPGATIPDEQPPISIAEADKGTPDEWIPRNPKMIRLTGRHPLNAEAPIKDLFDSGFLTKVSLHYVRNHGPVPRLDAAAHKIAVTGHVGKPTEFTVKDLQNLFPCRTIPITMACDGNRRKELNAIRMTRGFNWGPSGISTSIWTGVRLSDVLKHCEVKFPAHESRYVWFTGADHLPKGRYGTSLHLGRAVDPANDVLLAYALNGRDLPPDHGYPVRLIVPGFVGGRSVKWLSEIRIEGEMSHSYYHWHDNRVVPTDVDERRADEEGWWFLPQTQLKEHNINSAIVYPAHEEMLRVDSLSPPYILKGYAYSGGGRAVVRVDITLNNGDTWQHCKLTAASEPTEYGKNWAWVLWECPVEARLLDLSESIGVRAFDEAYNTQPERHNWNIKGMMNNAVYRVQIEKQHKQDEVTLLKFVHPVAQGSKTSGWLEPKDQPKEDVMAPPPEKEHKTISAEEVQKHNKEDDCWIILKGRVYDVTKFLKGHPGGSDPIMMNAGSDATEEFIAIHPATAKEMTKDYYIGELEGGDTSGGYDEHGDEVTEADKNQPIALNVKKRMPLKLIDKQSLSHDTRRLTFALYHQDQVLGLPTGKHVTLSARINDELVLRPYTPVTSDADKGHVDFVVKVYKGGDNPKYPAGGKMSRYLDSLKVGEGQIHARGPIGHVLYQGKGKFTVSGKEKEGKKLIMISGGTGITPMLQLMKTVQRNKEDIEITLIDANKSEEDILCLDLLEEIAAESGGKFKVYHVLSHEWPEGWQQGTGHVTAKHIKENCSPPSSDTLVLLCGPPPMIDRACKPALKELGYAEDTWIEY